MDNDTQPAGASAETNATPLSDALAGADRHQALERHETHREVGAAAEPPQPRTPPAPNPTPAAAPNPPAAPAASGGQAPPAGHAGEPDPASDPRAPKWYRDHMARVNRDLAAIRQENERLRTGRQPSPQPQPQPGQPEIPDPLEDPAGYRATIEQQFESRQRQFELRQTLSFSERFARREHGNEAFEECRAWLSTRPDLADYFVAQEDPWQSAMDYFKRERLAEEIGDDPNAWRERERARIRAELEAEMSGGDGGHASHTPARASMTTPARSAPPPPASSARSSSGGQDRDGRGRFAGPTPLNEVLGKRRG
jgi:hypothetical protein